MRRLLVVGSLLVGLPLAVPAQELRLPNQNRDRSSLPSSATAVSRGTGQDAIANQMAAWRTRYPFEFVLMTGDNLYGTERPKRLREEVLDPVQAAARRRGEVLCLARQSRRRRADPVQAVQHGRQEVLQLQAGERRALLRARLQLRRRQAAGVAATRSWPPADRTGRSPFSIIRSTHPATTHGSADLQRGLLEPVFMKHGVNVVLMGHEHFYERIKPQKGIAYFILGSSAKLRRGDLKKSALTVYGNDSDYCLHARRDCRRRTVLPGDQR